MAYRSGQVMVTVQVPAESRVFVNGRRTASTGTYRRFVSRGLTRGATYGYQIRVEVDRDGRTMSVTRSVELRAGNTRHLEIAMADLEEQHVADSKVETKLTLNVPAGARVFLTGRRTQSTGTVREFTTTKLALGESWNDYTIRVELEKDGRTQSREQTISLVGGRSQNISISLDVAEVASAR